MEHQKKSKKKTENSIAIKSRRLEELAIENRQLKESNLELKSQLKDYEQELITAIIRSIKQEELLIFLKHELKSLSNKTKEEQSRKQLLKSLDKLSRGLVTNNLWKEFEMMINDLQDNFTLQLKEVYPKLTSKDVKVCVFLRMSLSTKEIAELMGISSRSVEDIRYRLRKKLELRKSETLHDFIMTFGNGKN